jgi:hypothetical protein
MGRQPEYADEDHGQEPQTHINDFIYKPRNPLIADEKRNKDRLKPIRSLALVHYLKKGTLILLTFLNCLALVIFSLGERKLPKGLFSPLLHFFPI